MKNRQLVIQGGYRRYEEVTFVKGVSITAIVLMHLVIGCLTFLPQWVRQAALLGGSGVHVFFFCSGFGLFLSYRNRRTGFTEFIRKRMLRIYIPYIAVVLMCFLIPLVQYDGNRFGALCAHLFLYKMFVPTYESSFGEPFWYVSTLFQFYLVFIPLCRLKEKTGNRLFGLLGLGVSFVWWIAMAVTGLNDERVFGSFFIQYMWEFCLGMIIADYLSIGREIRSSMVWLLVAAAAGISLEGILGLKGGAAKALNDIPAFAGFGAMALLLYQIRPLRKIGIRIGEISFEWYLLQDLICIIILSFVQGWTAALLAFVLSLVAAFIYHRIILLFRKISKRIWLQAKYPRSSRTRP